MMTLRRLRITMVFVLCLHVFLPLQACDSSMLEILTGSNPGESLSAMLLSVSLKMQNVANYIKGFNNAAAENLHREVMEAWLNIASQITLNYPGFASENADFNGYMIQIARDLGAVRRKLASQELENAHDILEVCVTRMSLLSAIINKQKKIREFLELELNILTLRPLNQEPAELKRSIENFDLPEKLACLQLNKLSESKKFGADLTSSFKTFYKSISVPGSKISTEVKIVYQKVLDEFIKLKHALLAAGYFQDS